MKLNLLKTDYGKSRVRLMKVTRHGARHTICVEWTVQVLLRGDFESAHIEGDNSKILATDTMKNTVYSLSKGVHGDARWRGSRRSWWNYLLGRNPQVSFGAK